MMHKLFMELALKEAKKAFDKAEVPVGAVISKEGKLISRAHNTRERDRSVISHAELLAIQKASKKLNSWRLEGCQIYVSMEPCLMCYGAIVQARFLDLFYACSDFKGGFSSFYNLGPSQKSNTKINIYSGLLEEEGSFLLKTFFKKLRSKFS